MIVAGADVWKGKWIIVALDGGRFLEASVATTIELAVQRLPDAVIIGVDMPIGLPEAGQKRPADAQARAFVGPRRNSVFTTPSRDLLEASTHKAANELARTNGRDGITIQAYGLGPLIFQVEPVAESDSRLYEVHPEVSFVAANDKNTLSWTKTSWNGMNQRRQILDNHGVVIPNDLGQSGEAGIGDVLDAAIAAWSANRIASGVAERLPAGEERIGAIWL